MRIGVDARLVSPGLGIAKFVNGLARQLEEVVEIVWFGDPALAPCPVSAVRADRLPHPALDLSAARRVAHRAGIDVMHFTGNTGWTSGGSPPFVLTVHDMLFMDTPIVGPSVRQALGHRYVRRNVLRAVAAASAVATPSVSSAAEITRRAQPRTAPVVIPNGVDIAAPTDSDPDTDCALDPLPYALAFSARDPRKGVDLAVAGWRSAGRVPARLWLLAGAGLPAGLEEDIAGEIASGHIVLLPYLPRDRLQKIIDGASALVYPSRAEGFGYPVLEAMASGVPVITGLTPATLEVGGDAIVPIDPSAPVRSIAAGLRILSRDRDFAARIAAAGRTRAESYSWRACAHAYMNLYRAAVDG